MRAQSCALITKLDRATFDFNARFWEDTAFRHTISRPVLQPNLCMQISTWHRMLAVLFVSLLPTLSHADIDIGEAAKAPKIPPTIQPSVPAPTDITVNGGFTVSTDSREQVRDFYNAIYPTSANVPMNSTADVPNCTPGTNSIAFIEAVLRRINWFRAMAGVPAAVSFNATYNENAQQMAVMISANNQLNHNPPTNWSCYNSAGASQSGGNQAIGFNGADAITGYIWDFGSNNSEVGHRRWILLPQTQVMGTGDVPANGTNEPANSTWVFDSSINNPRPATRQPYVSWPPEGYVPYQVTYPYWSLSLSNANFTNATVTMKSNNVSVAVAIQPLANGYGENTLVWVPMGLDATQQGTVFPFNGTDTVYSVTVSNIGIANTTNKISFSYNVTVFDPAVPGADYIPPVVSGSSQPVVGASNTYSTAVINNPNVTSYEWIVSQLISGNLVDNASNGLANFTVSPTPDYSVITSAPDGSGNCFHLCHDNFTSQFLQLNEALYCATNTTFSFKSLVGYATSDESARVQASADGGNTWQDIYVQIGCNSGGQCESTFTPHTLSLSNYASKSILLRFNWAFTGGNYFPQTNNFVGWCIENIVVTNASQLINVTTNVLQSTNYTSGNLVDNANNGLANFTPTPQPDYSMTTNAPDGTGSNCFHLCHDNATSQLLQLNETLFPANNATVSFRSLIGYATSDESAHVQASTDGGNTWTDLFAESGCGTGSQCESSFTPHTVSLSSYAAKPTLLRFNWSFTGGNYYGNTQNYVGWCLENIVVTNTQQIITTVINSTNFAFTPTQAGTYLLQVVPVIFNQFPLSAGPAKQVIAILPSGITMSQPVLIGNQIQLSFTVSGGLTGTFKLLQANSLQAHTTWTTNAAAVLTTNTPGTSYRFTTTNGPAARFYKVQLGP